MGDAHGLNGEPPAQPTVYTIEAAIADALDRLGSRPEPDPATGVEHWIWTGTRLVRASREQIEHLAMSEALERAELQHLHELQAAYRRQRQQYYRRLVRRLVARFRSRLERVRIWFAG